MTVVTPKFGMGASVLRLEDQAFITGKGRYTDDIAPAGMLHGYVLRSPVGQGQRSRSPRLEAAKAAPGVHLVLTGEDLAHLGALKSGVMQQQPDGTRAPTRDIPILCRDRVNYVGDAVAFVVADSRALAQDAAELIEVDYDAEDAAGSDRDRARRGCAAGLAGTRHQPRLHLPHGRPRQDRRRLRQGRQASRASNSSTTAWSATTWKRARRSANGDADEDRFVLTTGSQGVHSMQYILAERVQDREARSCASSRRTSAAASARRPSSIANTRWCWRRRSASAGRSNGRATAPSIS